MSHLWSLVREITEECVFVLVTLTAIMHCD